MSTNIENYKVGLSMRGKTKQERRTKLDIDCKLAVLHSVAADARILVSHRRNFENSMHKHRFDKPAPSLRLINA